MNRGVLREILNLFSASLWVVASVGLLWRSPWLVALALGLGSWGMLRIWASPVDRVVFGVAAVLGVFGELLCTARGTCYWIYAPGVCSFGLSIPFWLPLVWGFLMLLFHRAGKVLAPLAAPLRWPLLLGILGFLLALPALVAPLFVHQAVLAAYGVFVGAMLFRWNTAEDALTCWAGGLMGTFGEYLCIRFGIWHYPDRAWDLPWLFGPGTVPMPATLPLAWGLAAVIVHQVAGWIVDRRGER